MENGSVNHVFIWCLRLFCCANAIAWSGATAIDNQQSGAANRASLQGAAK
jgi:hypothetical protein